MAVVKYLIAVFALFAFVAAQDVNYDKQGEWGGVCNKGKAQSPINIETNSVSLEPKLPNLVFENLTEPVSLEVTNKGYQVQYALPESAHVTVSGGNLAGNYILELFTFHWPSEHTIDGKYCDLEGQFVFYSEKYKSVQEALADKNGLAILVIFFETGETSSVDIIGVLANATEKVSEKAGSKTTIPSVGLADLIPFDNTFFTYNGSITIPNCDESVNYYIYQNPFKVTDEEYKQLTTIYNSKGSLVAFNNRDIQPLNGRTVCYKKED